VGGRDELDAQADTVPSLGFEPRLPALGVHLGDLSDVLICKLTCADTFQHLLSLGGIHEGPADSMRTMIIGFLSPKATT
jgi:hypothetical protein